MQVWHIFVLAALLGVVNAFDIPARQSFIVDMVGKEDLINAIALNSSMFNGARVVGPAIAGLLVASIGEGWCFFAERRQLYRGDRRPAADARDLAARKILRVAAGEHHRRLPLRAQHAADPRCSCCCSAW